MYFTVINKVFFFFYHNLECFLIWSLLCLTIFQLILSNTDILKSPIETVEIENCSAETTNEPHNACLSSPCINGMCQPNLDFRDYSCMCNYGYVGRNCEKILKQCEMLSPCKNGGTCHDQHGSYRCDCRLGYDGMDCDNCNWFFGFSFKSKFGTRILFIWFLNALKKWNWNV